MADEECVFGTNLPTWQGCLKRTVSICEHGDACGYPSSLRTQSEIT